MTTMLKFQRFLGKLGVRELTQDEIIRLDRLDTRETSSTEKTAKPIWLKRKQGIETRLVQLAKLPGTEDTVASLREAFDKINRQAETDELYQTAHDALADVKKNVDTAINQAEQAIGGLPEPLKSTQPIVAGQLIEFQKVGPKAEYQDYDAKVKDLIAQALKTPTEAGAIDIKVKSLQGDIVSRTRICANAKRTYEVAQKTLNSDLEALFDPLPDQYLKLKKRSDDIRKTAQNEYTMAGNVLTTLHEDAQRELTAVTQAKLVWTATEARRGEIDRKLKLLISKGSAGMHRAAEPLAEFNRICFRAENDKLYQESAGELAQLEIAVEQAVSAQNSYDEGMALQVKYANDFRELRGKFEIKNWPKIREKVKQFAKKKGKNPDTFGLDLGELAATLDGIADAWSRASRYQTDPGVLAELFKAINERMDKLQSSIDETLRGENNQIDRLFDQEEDEQRKTKERETWKNERQKFLPKLTALDDLGSDQYAALAKELTDLDKAAATSPHTTLPKLTELTQKVENAKRLIDAAVKDVRKTAGEKSDEFGDVLEKLKKLKIPEEYIKALAAKGTEVNKIFHGSETKNKAMLEAFTEEIDALLLQAKAAEKDVGKIKPFLEKLKKLEVKLKDADLGKIKPTAQGELKTEFETMSTKAKGQAIAEAEKTVDEFELKLTAALDEAAAIKKKRAELEKDFATWDRVFEGIKNNTTQGYAAKFPRVVKGLGDQIAAAKKAAEQETLAGVNSVDAMKPAIDEGLKKFMNPIELATDELNMRNAEEDELDALAAWKADYALFRKVDYHAASEAVNKAKDGDKGMLQMLDKYAQQANDLALKSKNFEAARKQLKFAQTLAKQAIAEPQGSKATSKKNLVVLGPRWTQAVKDFNDSVTALVQKIETECTEKELADPRSAAQSELPKLKTVFADNAFTRPLAVLVREDSSAADRKKFREEGLRSVRKYKAAVQGDPLLKHLITNPFAVPVKVSTIFTVLNDLDLNLQRCV